MMPDRTELQARYQIDPADEQNSDALFREKLLLLMPWLRAFSQSLCRDATLSQDICQQALCKAWEARGTFRPGSNLRAWTFTILRNELYNHRRRTWRYSSFDDGIALNLAGPNDEQLWAVHLADAVRALRTLSPEQRKAFMLVAIGGLNCEEAAAKCNCPQGTVKSRVFRARRSVLAALNGTTKALYNSRGPIGETTHQLISDLDVLLASEERHDQTQLPA